MNLQEVSIAYAMNITMCVCEREIEETKVPFKVIITNSATNLNSKSYIVT